MAAPIPACGSGLVGQTSWARPKNPAAACVSPSNSAAFPAPIKASKSRGLLPSVFMLRARTSAGLSVVPTGTCARPSTAPANSAPANARVSVATRTRLDRPFAMTTTPWRRELAGSFLARALAASRGGQAPSRPPQNHVYWLFCRFRKRGMSIGSRR